MWVLYPGRIGIWRCWLLWRVGFRSWATLVGGERSHHCAIPACSFWKPYARMSENRYYWYQGSRQQYSSRHVEWVDIVSRQIRYQGWREKQKYLKKWAVLETSLKGIGFFLQRYPSFYNGVLSNWFHCHGDFHLSDLKNGMEETLTWFDSRNSKNDDTVSTVSSSVIVRGQVGTI